MWFILALLAVIGWGIEDVFLRAGTDSKDKLSQYRIAVVTGMWFGICDLVAMYFSESHLSVFALFQKNIVLTIVPVIYAFTLILSHVGFRYLEASIMAPLKNAGGAFSTLMFLSWYAYKGTINNVWEQITITDIIGTILIVVGIIVLGYVENYLDTHSIFPNHVLGFWAFVFPLIFCCTDALDTVVCGIMLEDSSGTDIACYDYYRLYAFCFLLEGIFSWLYLWHKEKKIYNPFAKFRRSFLVAGGLEAVSMLAYIVAMDIEPMYVAVIITPYCVFTELTAYIFLKERFTKGQYLCFAAIILGILLMGCSELLA
ncbi:MAG: EamA family transporter [Acidaminococcaceae bacterium]|nr:EamA family transporter [Acidaminococcaceae bacterium]